jgi:hypothetical protein
MHLEPAEFVQLVYSEANTVSEEEKKSTINPEHVVRALDSLGFSSLLEDVNAYLKEVKESDQKRSGYSGLSLVWM